MKKKKEPIDWQVTGPWFPKTLLQICGMVQAGDRGENRKKKKKFL